MEGTPCALPAGFTFDGHGNLTCKYLIKGVAEVTFDIPNLPVLLLTNYKSQLTEQKIMSG